MSSEDKNVPQPKSEKSTQDIEAWKSEPGAHATTPLRLPLAAWKSILFRTYKKAMANDVSMTAAGVAFYTFMSLVPFIVAAISLYSVFFKAGDIYDHVHTYLPLLPTSAAEVIRNQLTDLSTQKNNLLGISTFISLLVTLWSSAAGISALITAINLAYEEKETRNFVKLRLLAITITLGFFFIGAVSLIIVAAVPPIFEKLGFSWLTQVILGIGKWPALFLIISVWTAFLYRYGPDRKRAKWRWLSAGSILATILWIIVCVIFSAYIEYVAHVNTTYGSLAGVVVLQMWLFLTALSVILGAEFNAEHEHQTLRDTTRGEPKPIGKRGAVMADTVPSKKT